MAEVERTAELPADLDRVWRMLTDERRLGTWLGGDVSVDLRPGGHLSLAGWDGTRIVGDVVEVRPRRRLAFVWWTPRPFGLPARSRVEVTLEERGSTTLLRLRESQLAPPAVTLHLPEHAGDRPDADGSPRLSGAAR